MGQETEQTPITGLANTMALHTQDSPHGHGDVDINTVRTCTTKHYAEPMDAYPLSNNHGSNFAIAI